MKRTQPHRRNAASDKPLQALLAEMQSQRAAVDEIRDSLTIESVNRAGAVLYAKSASRGWLSNERDDEDT